MVWMAKPNIQSTICAFRVTKTATKQIAVRHDPEITPDMLVRIDGIVYRFILFSPDNRTIRETYDLLTLEEVTKP